MSVSFEASWCLRLQRHAVHRRVAGDTSKRRQPFTKRHGVTPQKYSVDYCISNRVAFRKPVLLPSSGANLYVSDGTVVGSAGLRSRLVQYVGSNKIVLGHTMKVYWGSGVTAPLILRLGVTW